MISYSEALLANQGRGLGGISMRPVVQMIEPFEAPGETFPSITASEFEKYHDRLISTQFCPASNR